MILPFRLFHNKISYSLPLSLYSCGLHPQHTQYRPIGYPTLQCFICFGGSGTFHFQNPSYIKLKPNEMMIVPSKLAHDYTPSGDEPWLLGYMGIEGNFAEPLVHALNMPMLKAMPIESDKMKMLEQKLHRLWHIPDEEEQEAQRIASLYIYDLLTSIRSFASLTEQDVQQERSPLSTNAMLHAVKYMQQHYSEQLTIANIAYAVGYSKQHFQRKFKEVYGINPNQYLQRLRLEKAAQLLKQQPTLAISEAASIIGMDNNYFIRLFKREYGVTPAKYRSLLEVSGETDNLVFRYGTDTYEHEKKTKA